MKADHQAMTEAGMASEVTVRVYEQVWEPLRLGQLEHNLPWLSILLIKPKFLLKLMKPSHD